LAINSKFLLLPMGKFIEIEGRKEQIEGSSEGVGVKI
jgi:hypothetical protein